MEYQNFDCEIAEGFARVQMIGPGSPRIQDLSDEFLDLALRLQEDRAVRFILLTDGDHSFEFHHQLDELCEAHQDPEGIAQLDASMELGRKIVTMIADLPKLVVAATRGDIRDLGLAFYMAADIRLASSTASFTAPDPTVGLMPGWALTHTLPRLIGPGRTLDFLLSHRTVGAVEARELGLIDRLVPEDSWEEELDRLAERLRLIPQPAASLLKLAVQQSAQLDLTTMLSLEWESQQQCWQSLETTEGLRAWQEGRRPILGFVKNDQED